MTGISPLAMKAKQVIEAQWLTGPAYDLATQAAEVLESAQMLMSPEIAAELEALRAEVAALRAERHVTNEVLDDAVQELRTRRGTGRPEDVTPQVQKLRTLLAGQREALEGEHYAAVHHNYRIPRDLPPLNGTP